MIKKTLLLMLLFATLLFSVEKGQVYLIIGSDVSTNPYRLSAPGDMIWASQLYDSPEHNGYLVTDSSFRYRYRDTDGTPLKYTWWMMGGNVFQESKNCNIPIRSNFTLELMQKYHMENIQKYDDQISFHYHNYLYTDLDGDGIKNWNQGMDFNLSREDYETTLCKYLIENNTFPVSFRSGWHFMSNIWQAYQEKYIPFDMSNAYPFEGGSDDEPFWHVDWSQSPSAYAPYHPNADNYQIEGDLKQWRLRSVHFEDVSTTQAALEQMFQAAANGEDQMLCLWGHLAIENAFQNGIRSMHSNLAQLESQYGVSFQFCKDIEAMRLWMHSNDTIPPVLTFNTIQEGDFTRFSIESDEYIFQDAGPFLAIKTMDETYLRLDCAKTGHNSWESTKPILSEFIAKASVSACDTLGNQCNAHLSFVPDDLFIDDQDPCYTEISGTWQDFSYSELWDNNSRLTNSGGGSIQINPEISETRRYELFLHSPESSNSQLILSCQNSLSSDTVFVNTTTLQTNHWEKLGSFLLEEGNNNIICLENPQSDANFGYDVLRITPLLREKELSIDTDSIGCGIISILDTVTNIICLENRGYGDLTANISTTGHAFTPMEGQTITLIPGQILNVPVCVSSLEPAQLFGTLRIRSNDPLYTDVQIPISATTVSYFKLIDNDDNTGYSESGAYWFTSQVRASKITSRCCWYHGNGQYADFSCQMAISDTFDIQYIVPETENAHNHADYILYVDGQRTETWDVDQNANSGSFVSIGQYYLPKDTPITLRIQDNGGNTNTNNSIVLRADAVKFVPITTLESETELKSGLPDKFSLSLSYPNPFNPLTVIPYTLPYNMNVQLKILDVAGHVVKTLVNSYKQAGEYKHIWNGTDSNNLQVSSGIYFIHLQAEDHSSSQKIIFMK